jgi:nucleoid-associated protein YgaU
MEKLTTKKVISLDYITRYNGVATYYDTERGREICGVGRAMRLDTPYVSHVVQPYDTLDSLALRYYNNPTYWWAIAYFNKINDPFILLSSKFSVLKIPSLASITFKD